MKDFVRPRGRLSSLPVTARIVYSIFLAFTLAGLALTLWLAEDMVSLSLDRLDAYYAGVEGPPSENVEELPGAGSGPVLMLPDDVDEQVPAAEPMPTRKLLEVTHFHLFSMPVYLIILAHLYMLGRASETSKRLWIGLGTLSVAAHIAAPWVARDGTPAGAWFYGCSGAGLLLSFLVMSLGPLWEMWAPRGASSTR